jgi:methionine biosynthesis protein MetW
MYNERDGARRGMTTERRDHRIICDLIEHGTSVLDLGCGNGDLMDLLSREKAAHVQGIELDEEAVQQCVAKGLTVFHGDIESGLVDYPDRSFDVIILNQSMQECRKIDLVMRECLRVGGKVIVGFPNFAHLKSRVSLFFFGRTPMTEALPFSWDETPNVRFLSIKDFREFCMRKGLRIMDARFLGSRGEVRLLPNLMAREAILVVSSSDKGG